MVTEFISSDITTGNVHYWKTKGTVIISIENIKASSTGHKQLCQLPKDFRPKAYIAVPTNQGKFADIDSNGNLGIHIAISGDAGHYAMLCC